MRRIWIALLLLLCVGAAALAADFARFLHAPLANNANVTVVIESGTSFRKITGLLDRKGIISKPRYRIYLAAYARFNGDADRIKSGEYRIPAGTTPSRLLRLLTSGKTVQHRITIIDGWTFAQMREAIAAAPALKHTLKGESAAQIMAALGHADKKAEGMFLPDTYFFPLGATDLSIYRRAYDAMQQFLEKAWPKRADNVAVDTPYQALILASIVEKETAVPSERPRISGVFTRRLKKGMLLQTDASVIYGIKDFDGNITRKDLRTDTPYNTYINPGLPPTPIALPSRASIVAALHPKKGKAMYFVAKGDGTHKFSATLAQQNRAIRKYQLH